MTVWPAACQETGCLSHFPSRPVDCVCPAFTSPAGYHLLALDGRCPAHLPHTTARELPFTDPVGQTRCILVIPPGGKVYPLPGEAKIGVRHRGCEMLADLCVSLDAFWCPACKRNGRVSGAWCTDLITMPG